MPVKIAYPLLVSLSLVACETQTGFISTSDPDLTGNSVTYWLQSGSSHGITGTVSIFEKKDGSSVVEVTLEGISPLDHQLYFPVHLHLGDMATGQAEVAALLEPVYGATRMSKTELRRMADESPTTYSDLVILEACIKVHQSETCPGRDVILVAGNIGSAHLKEIANGRNTIGLCRSE